MLWTVLGATVGGSALAVALTPRRIAYEEQATIEAPVRRVYDVIRHQEHLMRWSAWPSETGSTCACEGVDGAVGARTAFFSKGKRFGHQEVVALEQDALVELTLESKGPPQRPRLRFELESQGASRTLVRLRFQNEIPWPFNLLLRAAGVVRWTRAMHRKDLDGLKRYAEPPHLTYTVEPAHPERAQAA